VGDVRGVDRDGMPEFGSADFPPRRYTEAVRTQEYAVEPLAMDTLEHRLRTDCEP